MTRVALCLVASLLLLVGAAEARRSASPASPTPCATIDGPAWTQTIDETAWLPPPKQPRLLELHGTRYHVFVDGVRCAWAARHVARLVPVVVPARLVQASPHGYTCGARFRHWQWDDWNGDAVRHSSPQTSIGGCTTQPGNAVLPGRHYQTFWWMPAKPCRTSGHLGECRKHRRSGGAASSTSSPSHAYLPSMSWPVRASVLRAHGLTATIDAWVVLGDPPFLGQIAGRCRNVRAIEADPRGGLLRIAPPARLRGAHADLASAYAKPRGGCRQARLTALRVRERSSGAAAARTSLMRFEHTTLRSFVVAAGAWRSAVLRDAANDGVAPPDWVRDLPVAPG